MRVLFWNVNQRSEALDCLFESLERLKLDIVVLAEAKALRSQLPAKATPRIISNLDKAAKIELLSITPGAYDIKEISFATRADSWWRAFEVNRGGGTPVTLCCGHLPSLRDTPTDGDLRANAKISRAFVELVESDRNSDRTIVVGDLNVDPYHASMVDADGYNALMSRDQVLRMPFRKIGTDKARTFYNPTWNCFGDHVGACGSYYWRKTRMSGYFWHMLDQVLLRGSIAPHFLDIEILTKLGEINLATRYGLPKVSDHFPLLFTIDDAAFEETKQ